jgi:hypothetical protein
MNVEIGAEAALFPEKEYNGIAVAVCGQHPVWIMEVIPRFLLAPAAATPPTMPLWDAAACDARRKVLDDLLATLNQKLGEHLRGQVGKEDHHRPCTF